MEQSITAESVLELRREMDLNQTNFWRRFGVTQGAGSRYERGRPMDAPLRKLIYLLHFTSTETYLSDAERDELETIR